MLGVTMRGAPISQIEQGTFPRRELNDAGGVNGNLARLGKLIAALYYLQRPVMSSEGLFWP
jgi:hypothetical protein